MARKVTIDVEARFVDNLTDESKAASKGVEGIGKAAEKAQKKVDGLGKKKARPIFDADNNKFLKKLNESDRKLAKFAARKATVTLKALDKASSVISRVLGKAKGFAGKVWSGILKVKDYATSAIQKVSSLGKAIGGRTWSAIVKIKDYATTPLRKIKDTLFSIKTLAAGIVTGMALKSVTQQGILQPIALADQYSGAKIGFSTLLGEEKGQKMMDDLDAFAKKSPFDTSGVISNAQKMLAMGWDAESVVKDMEIIGNAAASTGNLNQGLESIVRAMSQIKTKGKLSAEELNQLAEAGIAAKPMLAEALGYGTGDEALRKFSEDQEDGLIGADRALEALLQAMKKYDGMMDSMANETAEGLMSQLKDTFQVNILRRWGQGLQDGAKRGLGAVVSLLDNADDALSTFGDTVYEVGKELSNWAADKLEKTIGKIQEIIGSEEFKNASLTGKIKMVWSGAIGNPLAAWWSDTVLPWWDATVVPWLAEKAESLGKGLGSAISGGIATLLGLDASGVVEDGVNIGSSFMEGFLEGFDGSKIWEALKGFAKEHPWLTGGLAVFGGAKLASGLGGMVGNIKGLFGGGSSALGDVDTANMTVNAAVVNINSGIGGKGTAAGTGAETAGKVGFFGRIRNGIGSTGNAMVGGSGLLGKLASAGYGLTGGAAGSTLSGGAAAAIGGGSILGGLLGAVGIGSGVKDIWDGTKKSGKAAKDEYYSGGTKIGMVGTGAAAGAAIGSVVPVVGTAAGALIGAGVGGAGAMLGGSKLGKWLSDATDEGGSLDVAWKATKNFFSDTIPEAWNGVVESNAQFAEKVDESVSAFFNETLPTEWNKFWDGVNGFFTGTVGPALKRAEQAVDKFFQETVPQKWGEFWDGVGVFFTEKVPYAIGFAAGKVYKFFDETLPEKWNAFWGAIGSFFTETIPEWADTTWNDHIVPFFTETLPEKWDAFWAPIDAFFTETIPTWASDTWENHIVPFFTETIPEKWDAFWNVIGEFFTETIPAWAENVWNNHIVPFFTETLPEKWDAFWAPIDAFFTETIPTWAESVWNNNIKPFFTESIPGFLSDLWDSVTGFFTESLPAIGSSIWGSVKGFFTDTVPNWFGQVWDNLKSGFAAGSGKGESTMGGGGRKGFARGGIIPHGTRYIKVNEEGTPEMVIPLASQRRDRARKLWAQAGQMLGVDGFNRGGMTSGSSEGYSIRRYEADTDGYQTVQQIEMGGIEVNINVDAHGDKNIVEAIREQADEIVEIVSGALADAFGAQFENTPVRGGA